MKKGIIALLIIAAVLAFFFLKGEPAKPKGVIEIIDPVAETVWTRGARHNVDYTFLGHFPRSEDNTLSIVLRCDHYDEETTARTHFVSQLAVFENTYIGDMSPLFDIAVPTDVLSGSICEAVARHTYTDEAGERLKIEGVSEQFSVK